jgi:hypothetical protein
LRHQRGEAIKPNASGYLPTGMNGQTERAHVLTHEPVDLQSFHSLALVTGGTFLTNQVRELGYFQQVLTLADLQRRIVENKL